MKKTYNTPDFSVMQTELADILTLSLADYGGDQCDRVSWGIEQL